MNAPQRPRAKGIDWPAVRERLARIDAAVRGSEQLSPERAEAVMEDRARALARIPTAPPGATEVIEVATFSVANEHYAIETRHICEVARFVDVTPVPGAPDFFAGLLNLRGEILAVFDLRRFFGLTSGEVSELSRVIVLGRDCVEFGMLAGALGEVRTVRIDELHELPGSVAGISREFVRGVTARALVVLDGAAMLHDDRLFIDQPEDTIH
jgi:purine-binding chemotaxis protein CheW